MAIGAHNQFVHTICMMKILVLTALSSILLTGVSATCRPDEFRCSTGKCIPRSKRCNKICDCRDQSDERNCGSVICRPGEWRCSSGQCIPLTSRCNGHCDCRDKSDERNCPSTTSIPTTFSATTITSTTVICRDDQFTCTNGQCVNMGMRCDGSTNCQDGSDEQNCTTTISTTPLATTTPPIPEICPEDQFTCTNGQCVNMGMRCDGNINCQDGSDEQNCVINITVVPRI